MNSSHYSPQFSAPFVANISHVKQIEAHKAILSAPSPVLVSFVANLSQDNSNQECVECYNECVHICEYDIYNNDYESLQVGLNCHAHNDYPVLKFIISPIINYEQSETLYTHVSNMSKVFKVTNMSGKYVITKLYSPNHFRMTVINSVPLKIFKK